MSRITQITEGLPTWEKLLKRNIEFWLALDKLVEQSEIVIDRPKGSAHPRFPHRIYPLDYGYLNDTQSMDGAGIDVWVGTGSSRRVDAVICTVDLMKRDSEIKLLIGCTEEEKRLVYERQNDSGFMKGILIRRPFPVYRLSEADISELYRLCVGNPRYYAYLKCEPAPETLKGELTALPQGKSLEDKYFVGIYEGDRMIAILDLITGYPDERTAFIGWFMVDGGLHGQGIGTKLVGELLGYLRGKGFSSVRLGCIMENIEGRRFWEKQGFSYTGKQWTTKDYTVLVMQRDDK